MWHADVPVFESELEFPAQPFNLQGRNVAMKDVFPLLQLMPLVFNFAPRRGHRTEQDVCHSHPEECNYFGSVGDRKQR